MNELCVAETPIRQDAEGRYCLNDLHRASGAEPRHTPGRFSITQQFKDLVAELSRNRDSPAPHTSAAGVGTFVAKELVYAYAMWISAAFHLKVIRAYDAHTARAPAAPVFNPAALSRLDILKLAMESEEARQVAEAEKAKAEAALALAAPKVEALDRIARSDGSLCITDAAKTLQVQPRTLSQLLERNGWIYRRPWTAGYLAYQDRIQSGHLEHKVKTGDKGDGREWTSTQVRVTPRGLTKLAEVLRQDGLH